VNPGHYQSECIADALLDKEFRQPIQHVIRAQASLEINGQALQGVFIGIREQRHRTSILRAGGHEVACPDMIRMLHPEPDTGTIRQPESPTRRLFLRDL